MSAAEATAKHTDNKAGKDGKDGKPKVSVFKKLARYFRDLKSEFKKIVWPTKKQVLNNTGVVLVFMAISAVAIWALDWVFINIFKLIFSF